MGRRIGVLWSGDHIFDKVPETLEFLRSKGKHAFLIRVGVSANIGTGKQLVFVTNNSTKSRADYKKKFDKLGIPAKVVRVKHLQPVTPQLTHHPG